MFPQPDTNTKVDWVIFVFNLFSHRYYLSKNALVGGHANSVETNAGHYLRPQERHEFYQTNEMQFKGVNNKEHQLYRWSEVSLKEMRNSAVFHSCGAGLAVRGVLSASVPRAFVI